MIETSSRLKLAELSSTSGAGILGVGLGALLAGPLHGFGIPVLVLGLVLHAWGMTDKHRLEHGAARPRWSVAVYWTCWLALIALVAAVAVRASR